MTMSPLTATSDINQKKKEKEKEVLVIKDEAEFVHHTGDVYSGEFEVKKKDRIFKMHGAGTYKTFEGDVYTAQWEYDKILPTEPTYIKYHDGSTYYGPINNWQYTGTAEYTYPDGSVLKGNFDENCPSGNMELTDPNLHKWFGSSDQGFTWLTPCNHYYEVLESTRPVKAKRRRGSPRQKELSAANI